MPAVVALEGSARGRDFLCVVHAAARTLAAVEIERLRSTVGACTAGPGFDSIENALRGVWTMSYERGKLEVAITLAPTLPPTVQFLSVRPAPATPPRTESCP